MKNIAVAALSVIMLFSSATAFARELTTGEKKIISDATLNQLKDPGSAMFKWQDYKGGEIYCSHVNAKNSYGGYTGDELMIVGLKTDKNGTVYHAGVMIYNAADAEFMGKLCTEYGYKP